MIWRTFNISIQITGYINKQNNSTIYTIIKLYVNPNNSLLPFGLLYIPWKAFLISVRQVQIPVDSARKSSYLLVHTAFAALKSQAVLLSLTQFSPWSTEQPSVVEMMKGGGVLMFKPRA